MTEPQTQTSVHFPLGGGEVVQEDAQRYRDALVWALGSGENFRERKPGEGPYWWRTELSKRAGLEWDGGKYRDAHTSSNSVLTGSTGGVPQVSQSQPLSRKQIEDLAIKGGIYDCLTDPYDKHKTGDCFGSIMDDIERIVRKVEAAHDVREIPNDPECTCGNPSPRAYNHALSCPHSTPWNDRVKARLAAGSAVTDGVPQVSIVAEKPVTKEPK